MAPPTYTGVTQQEPKLSSEPHDPGEQLKLQMTRCFNITAALSLPFGFSRIPKNFLFIFSPNRREKKLRLNLFGSNILLLPHLLPITYSSCDAKWTC